MSPNRKPEIPEAHGRWYCGHCAGHYTLPCPSCIEGCKGCRDGRIPCPSCRAGELRVPPPDWS